MHSDGIEEKRTCGFCNSPNNKEAKYCSQCGAKITCDSMRPAEEVRSERRPATIIFADISGFTSISENTDPEQLRDQLNSCFEKLVPIITSRGGEVDKFIGDEVMAVFGGSKAIENDAESAVIAALEMCEEMKKFNQSKALDWQLHIGINSGLVITGLVGTRRGRDQSVIGDTVNLASRLARMAGSGEILVGERTYRHTRKSFDYEGGGKERVKGKAKAVSVYRLVGVREEQAGRIKREYSAPLVGRASQLSELKSILTGLSIDSGFMVKISGEPGVGKSRLLAELRQCRESEHIEWLEGKSISISDSISYWQFIEILKDLLGVNHGAGNQDIWPAVADLLPGMEDEVAPFMARFLSLDGEEEITEAISAEDFRMNIYKGVYRLFSAAASRSPMVLVFEDLHWADQSSINLISHIAAIAAEKPLGIILSERTGEAGRASGLFEKLSSEYADLYHEIVLQPLSEDDSAQMCLELLNTTKADSLPVVRRIISRTEGNPFFLEEMVRVLIELRILEKNADGSWQMVNDRSIAVPESLRGVILARLDSMDEELKQLIKHASVVGRSFLLRILEELFEASEGLESNLELLLGLDIIRKRLDRLEREYMFKHAIFYTITYETILTSKKKRLHEKGAVIIENIFSDRIGDFSGLLAYHYTCAENWEKAHEYLKLSSDRAIQMGADNEAIGLLERTLTAYKKAFGDYLKDFEKAVMDRKMGEALFRKGDHYLSEKYLHNALSQLGARFPETRTRARLSIAGKICRQVVRRSCDCMRRPKISPTDERMIEILRNREILGFIYFFSDRERMLLNSLAMFEYAENARFASGLIRSGMGLALILDCLGRFRTAERYFDFVENVLEHASGELDNAYFYHIRGYHEDCLCNWREAHGFYSRAYKIYNKIGALKLWGSAMCLDIEMMLRCKKSEHCLDMAREVKNLGREAGDLQLYSWGLCCEGMSLLYIENAHEAQSLIKESVSKLMAVPDYYVLLSAYSHLIEAELQLGNLEDAAQNLRKALGVISKHKLIGPFICGIEAKNARIAVKRFEATSAESDRKKARKACKSALKKSKSFRAFYPESVHSTACLNFLEKGASHEKMWRECFECVDNTGTFTFGSIAEDEKKRLILRD